MQQRRPLAHSRSVCRLYQQSARRGRLSRALRRATDAGRLAEGARRRLRSIPSPFRGPTHLSFEGTSGCAPHTRQLLAAHAVSK